MESLFYLWLSSYSCSAPLWIADGCVFTSPINSLCREGMQGCHSLHGCDSHAESIHLQLEEQRHEGGNGQAFWWWKSSLLTMTLLLKSSAVSKPYLPSLQWFWVANGYITPLRYDVILIFLDPSMTTIEHHPWWSTLKPAYQPQWTKFYAVHPAAIEASVQWDKENKHFLAVYTITHCSTHQFFWKKGLKL